MMMFNAKHLTSSLSQQRSKALIITLQYKTLRKVRQKMGMKNSKATSHEYFFMAKLKIKIWKIDNQSEIVGLR